MKKSRTYRENLFLLLKNNLVQFIIGMLACCILLKFAGYIPSRVIKAVVKSLGFGVFFYWTTPFTIYWLAYVSAIKLTKVSLGITIVLLSIYSYIFWDSYFFYKELITWLLLQSSVSY